MLLGASVDVAAKQAEQPGQTPQFCLECISLGICIL